MSACAATGVRRGVDDDELWPVRPVQTVENPHPEHGLGFGHVVPHDEQRVAAVDVGVRAGIAVAAEAFNQRPFGGRRAQPSVSVEMGSSDAASR